MWHVWERDEVPFRQETNWTMSALGNGGPDSDPYGGPLKFVQSTKKKLYMQVFSRLVDITAGGDFLGLCDQKSSYKHVSDFGRLRSYGQFFNSRTRPRVNRVLRNQLAGDVLSLAAYRLRCKHCVSRDSRSSQPSGSLCCGRWWHFRKPALSTDQFKLKVISRS